MLIVKLICMVLGTVLAVLFILFTLRGRKEDWRIEGVPQKEFSDKELWAAGFAMQKLPVFSMDSAVGKKMMSASAILHPENGGRFVEYWARLYWARTLSMSLLVLALAFCASVFMDGYMVFVVLIAGVAMVAVIYSNGANEMSNQLKKRSEGVHDGVFQRGFQTDAADELRHDPEGSLVHRGQEQEGRHLRPDAGSLPRNG